ncbi:BMP family ABC transporter substrate-binding protein [Desulfovibrio sulfodismutans]|uniref:BMP family ABC transporter substrate-binding protein n=1 Tax=Desulfolutivibrio sulfodismutans TaxID=63561 RepID=A0A7K3NRH5_9BACT|nr:BMP family ABC transporter substrate-binding protein [Desulfolutivibrio sulfodismutans]NDY58727.1 BMP family ABC transporter substrate-binding protein [Desulfolutivibrio sulfodismutans]QLA11579.1 BMP family ABC transporter substrate-binding protein [Desulfolutivibrio sulfodismutans DSM 3696]
MKSVFLALAVWCCLVCPAQAGKPLVGFITGTPGLGDASFNDMAHQGVLKAQQDFGFDLEVLQPKADGEADAAEVRQLVDRAGVIVLLGAQHLELAKAAALAHPEKTFILMDVPCEGIANMSSVLFRQHEGAFLAGALAASVSATGKIGFVGGAEILPVKAFEQGYREGAAYAKPGTAVLVAYASPEGDYSGFSNPEKGYRLAMDQYGQGADIVFAAAGRTGNGVIKAASDSGRLVIGVDSDQDALAKGTVLTSVIKRLDTAVCNEIKKVMDKAFVPGPSSYGLKDGGVRLSDMAYTRDKVPDAVMNRIAEIREKIISGEITVTNAMARE